MCQEDVLNYRLKLRGLVVREWCNTGEEKKRKERRGIKTKTLRNSHITLQIIIMSDERN